MKDRLIKFSATWLTLSFIGSILIIYYLELRFDKWPYLPYPSPKVQTIIVSILYSYIVSYVFFILTIIVPRVIKVLNWHGYVVVRFNQFYDAWTMIYIIHHFYFKIGNSNVIKDILVQSKAATTDLQALYNSNRYEVALNLQNCLYQLETFSQLVSNQSDGMPSSMELLFQEITFNPVKANIKMVIDILKDEKVTIDNAYSYALNNVKMFGDQFRNLSRLSALLRHNIVVRRHISSNSIFNDTQHLITWI